MIRFITFILFLVFISPSLRANDPVKADTLTVGDALPFLQFETTDGKLLTTDNLKGKTTMIVFFATWCGPCCAELPLVQKEIWNNMGNNPNFVLLVIGRQHTPTELLKFKKDNKYTFPIVADSSRNIYSHFAPQLIPRTYLIDKKGKIIQSTIGFNKEEFAETKKILYDELNKQN
jgi:peroxiredoxin